MTDADARTPSPAGGSPPAYAKGDPVLIPATIHLVGPEDALVTVGTGGPFPVPLSALVVLPPGPLAPSVEHASSKSPSSGGP